MKSYISRSRYIACTAVFTAVAAVLMAIEISVPIMPGFVKLDVSEAPALIASFVLGPTSGVAVCFFKNLIHLAMTTTSGVGELSNFILGVLFVLPAGLIYKYHKTRRGALVGALVGAVIMALGNLPLNYYVTYPIYANFLIPIDTILAAYKALLPSVETLWDALLIFNTPFTFVKGLLCAVLTFIVYKPLSNLIKGFGTPDKKRPIPPRSTSAPQSATDPDCENAAAADTIDDVKEITAEASDLSKASGDNQA